MPNMLHDRLRSAVYRSFVTCDDPKGVVECKTVRKSKSGSQKMEDKLKNQRVQRNSNTSSSSEKEREEKVSRGSTEDLHNMSSYQVMEVSREAQKLNEVIDSLSNRTSFDKQSKYIAKDLLRGALDLQESLVMLRELQESSRYIAKSKKKQKEKSVAEATFMDFNKFEENDQETDFQNPRTSVASSRDCYEELRDVIQESFARQNLLPTREKDLVFRNYNLDFCVDAPSSSSSQSSLIHSYSSNSSPSKVRNEKSKGPNLIAKLMGLEEPSSKQAHSIIYKQNENKMLSRHLIDIDLPRARKPPFEVQTSAWKRRTLEEMIETMQFKGLIGRKAVDRFNDDEDNSDFSYSTRSLSIENPPIVLMRPLHVPENRVFHADYYVNEQRPTWSRLVPRKVRKERPLDALEIPREHMKSREIHEQFPARRIQRQNLSKEGKISGVSPARPIKKTTDIQDSSSFVKIKHSKPPPSPRVQKKETIVKVIESVPKVAPGAKKQAEAKPSKSRESTKTQNQSETTSLKLSKPGRGSNVSKCQIAREKITVTDKHMIPTSSMKSAVPKKNLKRDKADGKLSEALVENKMIDNDLPIDLARNSQGSSIVSERSATEYTDASYNPTSETSGNELSWSGESSEPTVANAKDIEDGSFVAICDPDEMKGSINITDTRSLLLSSASFLSHAEELIDIATCDMIASSRVLLLDCEPTDAFDLLECAKEILARKSQYCSKTILSSPSCVVSKPKCHLSLDQLVQEISDGIEYLKNYSNSNDTIIVVDSIFPMLERDLWWKAEVTGAWDLGWKSGFSVEDVDEVVNSIEMLVLSETVDDMVNEFTFG